MTYRDLGGGVYAHGYARPTDALMPSCPYCGETGTASDVGHPFGRFYCSCGSLFWGTDDEWRRLARHRREAVERKTRPPLKPIQRPIPRAER